MRLLFKSLLTIILVIFSVTAFAVGSAPGPTDFPPTPPTYEKKGVFVDLATGYAAVDWGNFGIGSYNGYTSLDGNVFSNDTGGYTVGADVGYQMSKFLGVEAGWYYIPEVKGNSDINRSLPYLRLTSWMAYLALKIYVPLSRHFDLIGKTGLGYRNLSWNGNATGVFGFGNRNTNYFTGIFGAGLQYWFDQHWSVSAQYLYLLSNTTGSQVSRRAPSVNLIVATVAYIFAV